MHGKLNAKAETLINWCKENNKMLYDIPAYINNNYNKNYLHLKSIILNFDFLPEDLQKELSLFGLKNKITKKQLNVLKRVDYLILWSVTKNKQLSKISTKCHKNDIVNAKIYVINNEKDVLSEDKKILDALAMPWKGKKDNALVEKLKLPDDLLFDAITEHNINKIKFLINQAIDNSNYTNTNLAKEQEMVSSTNYNNNLIKNLINTHNQQQAKTITSNDVYNSFKQIKKTLSNTDLFYTDLKQKHYKNLAKSLKPHADIISENYHLLNADQWAELASYKFLPKLSLMESENLNNLISKLINEILDWMQYHKTESKLLLLKDKWNEQSIRLCYYIKLLKTNYQFLTQEHIEKLLTLNQLQISALISLGLPLNLNNKLDNV